MDTLYVKNENRCRRLLNAGKNQNLWRSTESGRKPQTEINAIGRELLREKGRSLHPL